MEKFATVLWNGGLKSGQGEISTESGALNGQPYSFNQRFGGESGTNPEELLAAAHAACFTMALANQLEKLDYEPDHLETRATVKLMQLVEGWRISEVYLSVSATVPGIDERTFQEAATLAGRTCPMSQVLKAEIHVDAILETLAQPLAS